MTDGSAFQRRDKGRCLCGAVTFTVVGDPIYNVVCHCENCRRHGGSIMHCASIFPKAQYTLHTGGSSITTYNDPATQSGQPLARSFCSICGSKLAARTPLNEDIVSIPAGILLSGNSGLGSIAKHEGADRRGVRWKPQKEQFCQEKAPWLADLGELVADERYVRGPFSEKVVDGGEGAGRL